MDRSAAAGYAVMLRKTGEADGAEVIDALLAELEQAEPLAAQYEALASVLRPVAKDLGLREGWTFDALGERLRERLSALEQAERERDRLREELRLREESQIPVIPRGAQVRIDSLEARLAAVPALVEALRQIRDLDPAFRPGVKWVHWAEIAREALAVFEQEQG